MEIWQWVGVFYAAFGAAWLLIANAGFVGRLPRDSAVGALREWSRRRWWRRLGPGLLLLVIGVGFFVAGAASGGGPENPLEVSRPSHE